MKNRKNLLIVIFCALLISTNFNIGLPDDQSSTSPQRTDLFWLSYQSFDIFGGCCSLNLMQIDQFGNVGRGPNVIIDRSKLGIRGYGTAMASLNQDKLLLWSTRNGRT